MWWNLCTAPNQRQVKLPMAKKINTKSPIKKIDKVAGRVVNLKAAAAHCGVGRATFDYHVTRYPDIPVKRPKPGEHWKGGRVDLDELDKWREATGLLKEKSRGSEMSAIQQQRVAAQTELLNMQLEERRGNLVERDEIIRACATAVANLAKFHDLLPMRLAKKMDLSKEVIIAFQKELDTARDQFVAELSKSKLLPK